PHDQRTALADRPVEKTLAERTGHEEIDAPRAGRFTEDRDVPRIAPELGDVLLYPLERGDLVQQPIVARRSVRRFLGQLWMREEAKGAEAIVDRHQHDTLHGKRSAVGRRHSRRPYGQRASVYPDHDGSPLAGGFRRSPDVQVQTIFMWRSGQLQNLV